MFPEQFGPIAAAAIFVAGVFLVVFLVRRAGQKLAQRRLRLARQKFQIQRERLEAQFLTMASQSGKPRGLAWTDCEFGNDVVFARDRTTGQLRALVAVSIAFEAVAGGGMEDNPNVANRRAATAEFQHDGEKWSTDGRAIFNLNPAEAVRYYQNDWERIG